MAQTRHVAVWLAVMRTTDGDVFSCRLSLCNSTVLVYSAASRRAQRPPFLPRAPDDGKRSSPLYPDNLNLKQSNRNRTELQIEQTGLIWFKATYRKLADARWSFATIENRVDIERERSLFPPPVPNRSNAFESSNPIRAFDSAEPSSAHNFWSTREIVYFYFETDGRSALWYTLLQARSNFEVSKYALRCIRSFY